MICALFIFEIKGAQAQSTGVENNSGALGSAQDCTEIQVGYSDDQALTNDEKLALMDRALFKSLSKFDACQTASKVGGGGGSDGSDSGSNGIESVASTGMSGTETPTDSSQDSLDSEIGNEETSLLSDQGNVSGQESENLDNGKVPDDIPLAS